MILKRIYATSFIAIAVLLLCIPVHAQDTLDIAEGAANGFTPPGENIIHNSVYLADFYEKLYQLKKGNAQQVNIIQVGDSHIQADFLSGTVREDFHRDFGNGGRGLIIPGRVARTNEPFSIVTSSTSHWDVKRCVTPDLPMPIGIGGITLRTTQPEAKLSIRTINHPPLDYGFTKVTLFYQKDVSSFNVVVRDSANHDLAFIGAFTFESFVNTSTVTLPNKTNFITLQTLPPTPAQTKLTLFGINLENGKPGVVYHAIGVNGAKYKNFVAASLFAEQTAVLLPDLFILSMGTNEALDYPNGDPQFLNDVDKLVQTLKSHNPNAKFILTIPADFFRRRTRRNPGVEVIRQKIIEYSNQQNIAYWDLYEAGGGKHSADLWRKNKLLRSDGVHYSAAGYQLQGNMLYAALIKGYNEYVGYRHP